MVALLPLEWALLTCSLANGRRTNREAMLTALTLVTLTIVALTESLSLFEAVSFGWLASAWALIALITVVAGHRRIAAGAARIRGDARQLIRTHPLASVVILTFLGGTLASAVLYPIVNYDSLVAHMPRVFFWFQNQSVAPHPTSNGAQLFSGTIVSCAVLHLKVLTGGSDRLSNLVQWTSYGSAILAVTLIARNLGASDRGQAFAALAATTVPMAVLQASTTQDGLTTALWCLVFIAFGTGFLDSPPEKGQDLALWSLGAGGSLGLAILAKASSYLVLAPFAVWFVIAATRRFGIRRIAVPVMIAALVALPLVGSWYVRNAMLLDGDVIGTRAPGMSHILVRDTSLPALGTNALKNSSMLLGTPFVGVNEGIASVVRGIVGVYGGDLENPLTKEDSSGEYRLDSRIATHDVGPSPASVLLIACAVVAALATARRTENSPVTGYVLCALASLALISGAVSWNLYINRILLGPELLLVPVVGAAVTSLDDAGNRWAARLLTALLVLATAWALFVMLFNTTNRLVPPTVLPASIEARDLGYWNASYDDLRYRIHVPELEEPYLAIAAAMEAHDVESVGIRDHVGHVPIYPLLRLLNGRKVQYVDPIVLPERMPGRGFEPDAIIEIIPAEEYPDVLGDGTVRGEELLEPQRGHGWVLLAYRAR